MQLLSFRMGNYLHLLPSCYSLCQNPACAHRLRNGKTKPGVTPYIAQPSSSLARTYQEFSGTILLIGIFRNFLLVQYLSVSQFPTPRHCQQSETSFCVSKNLLIFHHICKFSHYKTILLQNHFPRDSNIVTACYKVKILQQQNLLNQLIVCG